jgi:hypothetical protein
MNNDFNYRPQQRRTDGDNESAETEADTSAATDTSPNNVPAPGAQDGTAGPRKRGGFRKFIAWSGLLILLAAVAGGVYYWQQQQVKNANALKVSAEKQVASLQAQLTRQQSDAKKSDSTTAPQPTTINTDVVSGEVYNKSLGKASVSVLYKPGKVTALWLEYGDAPDKLLQSTPQVTQELGLGSPDSYGNQGFNLTGLQTGHTYFYRAAAKQDGKTIYGGVASFDSLK